MIPMINFPGNRLKNPASFLKLPNIAFAHNVLTKRKFHFLPASFSNYDHHEGNLIFSLCITDLTAYLLIPKLSISPEILMISQPRV